MATKTQTTTDTNRFRLAQEPNTDKQEAIVEVALDNPEASHSEIADLVEEQYGVDTDASWVSRVRKKFIEEVEESPEEDVLADVLARLSAIEGDLEDVEGVASEDDVDRAIGAVEDVADTVDVLVDHVRDMNDRLRRIEELVEGDATDELVADLLRKRAEELTGDAGDADTMVDGDVDGGDDAAES